jgi:hypothetical protein
MTRTFDVPERVAANIARRQAAARPARCVYNCDAPARLYACGNRCDEHSPWALAGRPNPATQVDPTRTAQALRTAIALRDQGIAQVTAAAPAHDRDAIDRAIRLVARQLPQFSANDVRPHLPEGVNPNLIGARFIALAKSKEIRKVDEVPSTDPGTHGKKVGLWEATARLTSSKDAA